MKLHLSKTLLTAVLSACSCVAAYAEETTDAEVIADIELIADDGPLYLDVGRATTTNSYLNNRFTCDTTSSGGVLSVGTGDLVGYFTSTGDPSTFVQSFGDATASGMSIDKVVVSNSLYVTKKEKVLFTTITKAADVTISGSGQVYLGGKNGSNQFAGLVANNVTLDSTACGTQEAGEANLWVDAITAKKLTIDGGTAYIRTSYAGGNSMKGNYDTVTGLTIDSVKSATISDGLYINGGYLKMGRQSNGNTVGSGNRNETDAHFVNVISGELKQTGGTAELLGKTYLNVSTIEQENGTMTLASDPTAAYEYLRLGKSTTTIKQTGDGTLNVEGKIIFGSSGSDNMKLMVEQTGNGSISLDNGVMFTTKNAASASLIDQQADGKISLGGDYTSATFNISQSGSGTITLRNGAAVNADTVTLTNTNVTDTSKPQGGLVIEKGATLTADSISIDGGKLENRGTVKGDIHIGTVATTFSLLARDVEVTTGQVVNSGTIEGAITMSGGALVLEDGSSVAGLSATGGEIQVEGNVTMTDDLVLDGDADLIFEDSTATIDLGEHQLDLKGGNIAVTLTDEELANLANVNIALFTGAEENAVDWGSQEVSILNTSGQQTNKAVLNFTGNANGDVTITVVPEPATTTLSLLALIALASRRRRK